MRLTSVQIENFKNIEDSTPFRIDDVTCLVGKNESGKTAILEALYRLNPFEDNQRTYDRDEEYPRRFLLDYNRRHEDRKAVVATTIWKLDDSDKQAVIDVLGSDSGLSDSVEVKKTYDSKTTSWSMNIDEGAVVRHLIQSAGLAAPQKNAASTATTIAELKAHLETRGGSASAAETKLLQRVNQHFARGTAMLAAIDILSARLPKFVYFTQYDRMHGQVSLNEMLHKQQHNTLDRDDQVFLAFLDLVDTNLEEIATLDRFESMNARFQGAGNKITRELFEYWSQNRYLEVRFRLDQALPGDPEPFNTGKVLRTRVYNKLHEVDVSFDDRSTGFVWFFSFLVLFSQVKETHGDNVILLLDEPGLSLHAKAQDDWLRYINEKLRPHHQVIYTTHSPFMVPVDNLLAVRTVEDKIIERPGSIPEVLGTKVGSDILSRDRETLFPLQGALGYDMTQSLFVGKHTLVVEGSSDLLYLQAFSQELRERRRTGYDPRWTIAPVGGIDKVMAFVNLFGGNKLHVAVLTDYASGQKKAVAQLRDRETDILRQGHVLTADTYADQAEADIEDIIGRANYVELVNRWAGLKGKHALPAIKPKDAPLRVVEEVATVARVWPAGAPEYDHYPPAEYLLLHRKELMGSLPDIDGALDRFERLFTDLNGFLPS